MAVDEAVAKQPASPAERLAQLDKAAETVQEAKSEQQKAAGPPEAGAMTGCVVFIRVAT